jgi:hypothetical protein
VSKKAPVGAFFVVRPAWAHSWRCKPSRELVTVSEVKRNCMRSIECGKEAWSVNHEPMDKSQIEGGAEQGERARNRKAFVTKAQAALIWRLCDDGVRAYMGRSRLVPERAKVLNWGEKSAEVVVAGDRAAEAEIDSEGPKEWKE